MCCWAEERDSRGRSGRERAEMVERATEFEQGVLLPLRKQAPIQVVCIGGGTGLPLVLKGLARRVGRQHDQPRLQITAIVAMSDDGGSSGRLRRSRGSLPPGDVRKCLVALASGNNELSKVFRYRFAARRAWRAMRSAICSSPRWPS